MVAVRLQWNNASAPDLLVRWLSPGDCVSVAIKQADAKARYYKRVGDGAFTTVASSGTAVTLTSGRLSPPTPESAPRESRTAPA